MEVGVSTTAIVAVLTTAVGLLDVVAVAGIVSSAVLVGDICAFEKNKFINFVRAYGNLVFY